MTGSPPDVDSLLSTVARFRDYLGRNREASARSEVGVTSRFWRSTFDARANFPDVNGLLAFRRGSYTYGLADERQQDEAAERRYFERIAAVMRHSVSSEFVKSIPEPAFGAPYVFDYGGCARSASFVINAATALHVSEELRRSGLSARALDACEIGPGWGGCAYQLHQLVNVRSYTLVDLPENLLLSSSYLASTLPGRSLEFIDAVGERLGPASDRSLRAGLPASVQRLGCQFDLILNSFSLQEMERSTVEAYLRWILDHLLPNGIFVSINSHGKAGMMAPRDYGFERFNIRRFGGFRKYPTGFFNTIPYALTLGPRTGASPAYEPGLMDVLCGLMQLGLADQVRDQADAFARGTLSSADRARLGACEAAFRTRGEARLSALAALRSQGGEVIADYVEAHLRLCEGSHEKALAMLRSILPRLEGFALTRAEAILSAAQGRWIDGKSEVESPQAYPELEPIVRGRDMSAFTRHFESVIAAF